jgi:hypothetical protein
VTEFLEAQEKSVSNHDTSIRSVNATRSHRVSQSLKNSVGNSAAQLATKHGVIVGLEVMKLLFEIG